MGIGRRSRSRHLLTHPESPEGRAFVAVIVLALLAPAAWAWGPQTHKAISTAAVSALPEGPRGFYVRNESLIGALSNLPDLWRDTHRKEEGFHHFADLDLLGWPPFNEIPRSYAAAEKKYGRRRLLNTGVLPWTIQGRYQKLVSAMRRRDAEGILIHSAVLSHYVADGQNPLHTTSQYDGRTPAEKGIHARLEMDVADRRVHEWRVEARPARVLNDVSEEIFRCLVSSFAKVGVLYEAEDAAARVDPSRGDDYRRTFAELTSPIITQQLRAAAEHLADLYYTAWLKAGRPKLSPKAVPLFWGR